MKHKNVLFAVLFLFSSIAFAQSNNFSVGLIGTQFSNLNSTDRISQIDNPFGYGLIVGYKINQSVTVALTGEYFKGDIANSLGEEKNLRAHLSVYLLPVTFGKFSPYISTGWVYTNRNTDFTNNINKTKNFLNGRIGLGVDYALIQNLGLNADFGMYTDGLSLVGFSSSVGLRFIL